MKTKLLLLFSVIVFQSSFANSKNDIVVTDPTAIALPALSICDSNNDGFGAFDLTTQNTAILAAQSSAAVNYIVSYYETLSGANVGANPISSPYINVNPFYQTVYYRVTKTTTSEFAVGSFELIVNPIPVANNPPDISLCDSNNDGFEVFNFGPLVPIILGVINPSTTTVTFYTSQANANAEVSPIIQINTYAGTNGQTIWARLENIATGCYDLVSFNLNVNPLPQSLQPNYPEYALCDSTGAIGSETFDLSSRYSSILLGQTGMNVTYYPSLANAQNNTNFITNPSAFVNQVNYVQTLGIRITSQVTGCYVISTMDIRVVPLPQLVAPSEPYAVCDANQDGFAVFDLDSLIPDLVQGAPYTVSFHETEIDALIGANGIASPYVNINPFVQNIYVRAEDQITNCSKIITIELNVNPAPIAFLLSSIAVCDTDASPLDGTTTVDLTQKSEVILAQQPLPASNYTVTYYTTISNAENGTGTIISPTNYIGSNGESIWYRVENNTTACYNVGSFQLMVGTPFAVTTPTPLQICDSDANPNNQFVTFNLTVKNTEINQDIPVYIVTYYPSYIDALNNTNLIATPTAYTNVTGPIETLGVRVTTPSGCVSFTTLDIRVLPIPAPNTNPPALAPQCDVNNPGDMLEVFVLTVNEVYIMNGDPNLTFHYYYTAADATAGINEILTPTVAVVGTNVWIRVENTWVDFYGNHCYVLVEQPLTVHPLPTVVQPVPLYRACDDNDDGITVFDLDNLQLKSIILGPTQLPSDYTVSYYLTAAGANPLTNTGEMPLPAIYTNVTAPYIQSIYIRVESNTTGCVNATGILDLVVEDQALASAPISYATCDDNGNPYDGIETIDLNQFAAGILGTQNPAVFLLSYYTSLANAEAGINALTPSQVAAYQTDADTDTIWVKVENSSNSITPLCHAITTININVERSPNPIIATASGLNTVYVDGSNNVVQSLLLDSGVTGNYTYEWYLNGIPVAGATNSTYIVDTATPNNESRSYSVRVENNSSLGCFTMSLDFVVFQSDGVPPPSGFISQTLPGGSTLANIIVSGTNVQWYASATNKNAVSMFSAPLPLTTLLTDGTTYYASQTIGGIESAERLPVTVHLALGIDNDAIFPIQFAPNPVKNRLTLKSNQVLKSVVVYTMLGQKVFEKNYEDSNALLDLSHLSAGNYILKVQGETGQKTIRLIKE